MTPVMDNCTDYGHSIAKFLILCGSNSNPNPKQIFGMKNMGNGLTVSKWVLPILSAQAQKLGILMKKMLHWVSIFSGQRVCNPTLVLPDFYYSSVKITHIMHGWINKEELVRR